MEQLPPRHPPPPSRSSSSPPPSPVYHPPHSAAVAQLRTGRRGPSSSSSGRCPSAVSSATDEHMVITLENHLPPPLHDQMAIRKRRLARKEGKSISPTRESYSLSPSTTVGALKDFLRKRLQPAREFMLLQEGEDEYLSALLHTDASLTEYHIGNGDTLHLTPLHEFQLDIYDATPMEHCFIPLRSITPAAVNGQLIHLCPSVYYTVANLKEIIFNLTGYSPDCQLMNPLSTRLHEKDDQTLLSLGFKCSKEIQQLNLYYAPISIPNRALPSPKLQITFVADSLRVANKSYIDPNITVMEMRCNVLVVGARFKFSFGTTPLEDDKTLSYYGIRDGDVINMLEC